MTSLPPKAQVMELIFGRWRSQTLYAGVRLGIFDALASGPATSDEIATRLELDPDLGYRLLRALGTLGVVAEDESRRFSLTDPGQYLRADHPETLRGITLLEEGPEHYAIWKHLPEMVREGRQNAFVREYGRMAFEHAAADPSYGEAFDAAMSSFSAAQCAWVLDALSDYDFSSFSHVCDVAGGQGFLLAALLEAHPHLSGTVLERADVLADSDRLWGNKKGLGDRCAYVAGDMFSEAPPADAYFMKLILHDWNDDECVQILSTQADSVSEGGRVFIIEHLVTRPSEPHFAKLFDIHMMCWGTGRERTPDEYAELLRQSGWRYETTHYPSEGLMGIVEGRL